MIHLNRDRQNLGQFSPEEISEGLRSGRFLPSDLGWREGMEGWLPLSAFTDLPAAEEALPPTLAPGSPLPEIEKGPVGVTPAWERESDGWFARAFETIREVLATPQPTFAAMPLTGGFPRPLIFALLVVTLCGWVSLGYSMIFETIRPRTGAPGELSVEMTLIVDAVLMVLFPLLVAAGTFLSSGILHVSLMIVGVTPKSFEATYRVVCYANGATAVFLLVPLCGGLIQGFWNLYTVIIGLREVHGTTTGKAIVAVLLPGLLCCGLVLGCIALAVTIPALSQMAK